MASAKKIGSSVEESVGKALSNIGSMKPDMKGGDTELKSATAPQRAMTRGEAFKAARLRGDKTFTWGSKSYHTRTAEEEAKARSTSVKPTASGSASVKPAASSSASVKPTASGSAPVKPATTGTKPATTGTKPATTGTKPATTGTKPARPKDNVVTGREALSSWWNRNMGELRTASASARASDAAKQAKAKADKAARDKKRSSYNAIGSSKAGVAAAAAANKRYAKGGSVDGCAVRGKTRAPMKKGK